MHYDNNFANAFWDGQRMTYGDGDATIGALVSPDICGHEIGHGLQQYTAGFGQGGETGALGESYSDILGLLIEDHIFPTRTVTQIFNTGDQPANDPNGVRNYIDPSLTGHPNTYQGTNWDASGQNVHGNGVVQDHWFYILSEGKTGVNDNSDAYSVNGIGLDKAGDIAFRCLTVYLTPNADFEDSRFYAIQSAKDIYGGCSNEEIETTNAWYAVGVGDEYDPALTVDFDYTVNVCDKPVSVTFSNNSTGASTFVWDFGDGMTSTNGQPTHTYPSDGQYTVKLVAQGCNMGTQDSLTHPEAIDIDNSIVCDSSALPQSGEASVNGCHGWVYDSGGEDGDAVSNTSGLLTINGPVNSIIKLKFSSFEYSFFGTVTVYDGPDRNSSILGTFDSGNTPDENSVISSTGNSLSIHERVESFPFPVPLGSGFSAFYSCEISSVGINEVGENELLMFPNPANGLLNVKGSWKQGDKIEIVNGLGKLVESQFLSSENANNKVVIDLTNQPSGIYFLRWTGSNSVHTKKFMLVND